MRLTHLGGADEIGASSTLVELGGRRVLVDCGIRMSARQGEILPLFSRAEELGGADAIVLTHAHLDHSGGLPVAYQSFRAPIVMTPPTLAIVTTLLLDALKLMEMGQAEGELPIYSQAMLEQALAAVKVVPFLSPFPLFDDVTLTFHPAGHILGAASVALESAEGSVLLSGDIAATEQLTVPGLKLPSLRPDALVIESTYGNRAHASRALEEQRLLAQVGEVLDRKGAVLIPAFAIGRAQELLLILSRAMEQGKLPRAPIIADGMVKQVCAIYTSFAEYGSPWLQKRAAERGNPFFYEKGPVRPVWDPKERPAVAAERPVVIVASSGMLSGGPSQLYAKLLAKDPNSFIAFTGYQDEESPGRKIQEVAAAGGGELTLGQSTVRLACRVGTYGLSAHSDATALLSEIEALSPKDLVLVHGYKEAKRHLEEKLSGRGIENIHCPRLGDTLEVTPRTRRARRVLAAVEAAAPKALTPEGLKTLAERLFARDSTARAYTLPELLLAADYPPAALSQEEQARVAALLTSKESPFKADAKQPFLYRLRVSGGQVGEKLSKKIPNGTQQPVLGALTRMFPPKTGLYRKSVVLASRSIVLSFHFPKVAAQRYQKQLEELQATTPWRLELSPEPNHASLTAAALEGIPPAWGPAKNPSLHLAKEQVVVTVEALVPAEAEVLSQAYQEKTGFGLVFRLEERPKTHGEGTGGAPQSSGALGEGEVLELNAASRVVREAFAAEAPEVLLRLGLKTEAGRQYLEAGFLTPEVGARYRETLSRLSARVGYEIRIRSHPDQHRMKELLKELLPLEKEPGVHIETRTVAVTLSAPVAPSRLAQARDLFFAQTGYTLQARGR